MITREVCETQTWVYIMCRLVRVQRKMDEGTWDEEGGSVRTKEVRKWDKGSSRQVKGNGDPHLRNLTQNQSYRSLKVRHETGGRKCHSKTIMTHNQRVTRKKVR